MQKDYTHSALSENKSPEPSSPGAGPSAGGTRRDCQPMKQIHLHMLPGQGPSFSSPVGLGQLKEPAMRSEPNEINFINTAPGQMSQPIFFTQEYNMNKSIDG